MDGVIGDCVVGSIIEHQRRRFDAAHIQMTWRPAEQAQAVAAPGRQIWVAIGQTVYREVREWGLEAER